MFDHKIISLMSIELPGKDDPMNKVFLDLEQAAMQIYKNQVYHLLALYEKQYGHSIQDITGILQRCLEWRQQVVQTRELPEQQRQELKGIIEQKEKEIEVFTCLYPFFDDIEKLTIPDVQKIDAIIMSLSCTKAGDNAKFYQRLQLDSFSCVFMEKFKNTAAWQKDLMKFLRNETYFANTATIQTILKRLDEFFMIHAGHAFGLVNAFNESATKKNDPGNINVADVLKGLCVLPNSNVAEDLESYLNKLLKMILPYVLNDESLNVQS